jgi:hypothetical protein
LPWLPLNTTGFAEPRVPSPESRPSFDLSYDPLNRTGMAGPWQRGEN